MWTIEPRFYEDFARSFQKRIKIKLSTFILPYYPNIRIAHSIDTPGHVVMTSRDNTVHVNEELMPDNESPPNYWKQKAVMMRDL